VVLLLPTCREKLPECTGLDTTTGGPSALPPNWVKFGVQPVKSPVSNPQFVIALFTQGATIGVGVRVGLVIGVFVAVAPTGVLVAVAVAPTGVFVAVPTTIGVLVAVPTIGNAGGALTSSTYM